MDWTKKIQSPELFEFHCMEDYEEWLICHSNDIPKADKALIFRVYNEDYLWLKIGTGCHKISDLEPIE